MAKTKLATAPIYDLQKQVIEWIYARREFIKMNGIEKQAQVSKYAIGRALKRYEAAEYTFERLESLPFSAAPFIKILPILLRIGLCLQKEGAALPVSANERCELIGADGALMTFPQLIDMYQKM